MTRVPAWLVWSAVGLQVILVAIKVLLEALAATASSPVNSDFVVQQLGSVVTILTYPAVGVLIYLHRPTHPIGWIFCLINLGWAVNNFATAYAWYALVVDPGSLPGGQWAVWFYGWPGIPSTTLLIALVLLFPSGKLSSPRWRPFAWFLLGFEALATVGIAFAPGPADTSGRLLVDNPLGVPGVVGVVFGLIGNLGLLAIGPLLAAAAVSMILRFRGSSGVERQQLKWITTALGFVTVTIAVDVGLHVVYPMQSAMPAWALLVNELTIASTALIPVAAGVAILRYRLYDIDVIIRRTLVYGVLTALLALFYWGIVVSLQSLLRPILGEGNDLAVVISTLTIAALFLPLRRGIQNFIDRRFFRRKYDAAKTLANFSATVRDEVDLSSLTGRLVEVVDQTIQPAHISLWMRPSERKA